MSRCHCLHPAERRVSLHVRSQLRKRRRDARLYTALLKPLRPLKPAWTWVSVPLQMMVRSRELRYSRCFRPFIPEFPSSCDLALSLSPHLSPQLPGWCLVKGLMGQERPWGSIGRTRLSSRECLSQRYWRSRGSSCLSSVGNHVGHAWNNQLFLLF